MDERCEAKASRLQERGLHQHGFSLEEMLWQGKHIIGFQQASMLDAKHGSSSASSCA